MRIRSKIVALIAVPLLILSTIAVIGFSTQSRTIEVAEDAKDAIEINQAIDRLVVAVGNERLAQAGADVGEIDDLRSDTDSALERLAQITAGSAELGSAVDATSDAVEAARIDERQATFDETIDRLLALDIDTAADYPSAESLSLATVGRLGVETLEARERAWLGYLAWNGSPRTSAVPLAAAFADANGRLDTLISLSASTDTAALDAAIQSGAMRQLRELEIVAADDLAESTRSIEQETALAALGDFRSTWSEAIDTHAIEVAGLVDDELGSATSARSLAALVGILGAMVLTALLFVVHRSLTNPLEHLLESADEIAYQKLPRLIDLLRSNHVVQDLPEAKPIPVEASDEVGELVRAFNNVQLTAFDLAREQAIGRRNMSDMFVNLGRRNQHLLQGILSQLTRLQRQEEDPEILRELFELDNAVTRMRRNAESLVALAGAQTPRQWSRAIDVDNVVRGAFGEVEGYERIEIASLAGVRIHGSVVADVTHLIAELLENALNFSDAQTPVMVSGHREGARYDIFIVDQGIGMSPNELAEYNLRITEPPPLERVATKFLGLYVVGRLAERHGVTVRLSDAPNRGVMAKIELPTAILDIEGSRPDTPLRAESDDGEQSPLEQDHDLDAELQTMIAETDPSPGARELDDEFGAKPVADEPDPERPTLGDNGDLPTRGDDDGDLPTRRGSEPGVASPVISADTSAILASLLPNRANATAAPTPDTDLPTRGDTGLPTRSATGDLPTRGDTGLPTRSATGDLPTRGDTGLPTRSDPGDLPTRRGNGPAAESPAASDTSTIPAGLLPTRARSTAEPTPDADLPTRGGDTRSSEPKDGPGDGRSGLDQRTSTDHSERSAGDFSSMMSALSSGISRGLTEASANDQERSD